MKTAEEFAREAIRAVVDRDHKNTWESVMVPLFQEALDAPRKETRKQPSKQELYHRMTAI